MTDITLQMAMALGQALGQFLVPAMLVAFVIGLLIKICIYYQSRRLLHFLSGLETHVHRYIDAGNEDNLNNNNFHRLTHNLLQRTYCDSHIWRPRLVYSRKEDAEITTLSALFMTDRGVCEIMSDTLKQVRYYSNTQEGADWERTSSYILSSNPYFTKLFGRLSVASANRFLGILPGLFIVVGILGTFLGIVMGLPALSGLDPKNVTEAQAILGEFLQSMSLAMNSSVFGIMLSIIFSIVNAVMSVNATTLRSRDKLAQALNLLWNEASIPADMRDQRRVQAEKDRIMIERSVPGEDPTEANNANWANSTHSTTINQPA